MINNTRIVSNNFNIKATNTKMVLEYNVVDDVLFLQGWHITYWCENVDSANIPNVHCRMWIIANGNNLFDNAFHTSINEAYIPIGFDDIYSPVIPIAKFKRGENIAVYITNKMNSQDIYGSITLLFGEKDVK